MAIWGRVIFGLCEETEAAPPPPPSANLLDTNEAGNYLEQRSYLRTIKCRDTHRLMRLDDLFVDSFYCRAVIFG